MSQLPVELRRLNLYVCSWPVSDGSQFLRYLFFAFWAIPCHTQGLLLAMRSEIAPGSGTNGTPGIEPRFVLDWLNAGKCLMAMLLFWPSQGPFDSGDT